MKGNSVFMSAGSKIFKYILLLLFSLLIALSCSHSPTKPNPEPSSDSFVYISAFSSSRSEFRLLKIDAATDSIVDSVLFSGTVVGMYCSPDGKQLWLSAQSDLGGTRVMNTSDWSVVASFPEFVKPIYRDYGVMAFSYERGVLFLDRSLGITAIDTTAKLTEVFDIPGTDYVVGVPVDSTTGRQYRIHQYYDCRKRRLADLVDFHDSQGRAARVFAVSEDGRLFGFTWTALARSNWVVFDTNCQLLSEKPFYAPGDIIFTDDGGVILTDPGDSQDRVPSSNCIFLYDANTYELRAKRNISRDSRLGASIPGMKKAYITCTNGNTSGPFIVVDSDDLTVKKTFYPEDTIYFGQVVLAND